MLTPQVIHKLWFLQTTGPSIKFDVVLFAEIFNLLESNPDVLAYAFFDTDRMDTYKIDIVCSRPVLFFSQCIQKRRKRAHFTHFDSPHKGILETRELKDIRPLDTVKDGKESKFNKFLGFYYIINAIGPGPVLRIGIKISKTFSNNFIYKGKHFSRKIDGVQLLSDISTLNLKEYE